MAVVWAYNPDQERDDRGRWSPSGSAAAKALDEWMAGVKESKAAARGAIAEVRARAERPVAPPSDPALRSPELAHLPVDAIYEAAGPYSRGDMALAAIWKEQGFDGKPTVVSPDEFDAARGDSPVLYRGIDRGGASAPPGQAEAWAEQFRTGDAFVGRGAYGNGTYVSTSQDVADRAAQEGGAVVKMALREDARVVDYDDMYPKFREWDAQWQQRVEAAGPEQRAALEAQRSKESTVIGDVGRHAAVLGYQAVRIPGDAPDAADVVLIQDRTALIVEAASSPTDRTV